MTKLITKHAKYRINGRIDNKIRKISLLRIVMRNGKTLNMYNDSFKQYLLSKCKDKKLKVYNDNIYVISKNSKRLITVYHVPDKYCPTKQYEIAS